MNLKSPFDWVKVRGNLFTQHRGYIYDHNLVLLYIYSHWGDSGQTCRSYKFIISHVLAFKLNIDWLLKEITGGANVDVGNSTWEIILLWRSFQSNTELLLPWRSFQGSPQLWRSFQSCGSSAGSLRLDQVLCLIPKAWTPKDLCSRPRAPCFLGVKETRSWA